MILLYTITDYYRSFKNVVWVSGSGTPSQMPTSLRRFAMIHQWVRCHNAQVQTPSSYLQEESFKNGKIVLQVSLSLSSFLPFPS